MGDSEGQRRNSPTTSDLNDLARIISSLGRALTRQDCDKLDRWASTRTC
ncbi:hypothetical protein SAMN02982929_04566 [Saccharopolyspora kobensis]|uniref:Uncharacterized protein n=1 Tax=Saccharopolyspora kobensis TaxID=146035 RepID=A0A1H6DJF5_9PSEU|nr:hypothetical protein SAMN02982929_04566 [Saccharopolyspora kobensis]SFD24669.1 hypothetical protein SAMN05216506_103224 [Saccharopolyspora kobensis]